MKKQQPSTTTARKPQNSKDNSEISVVDTSQARNGVPPGTVASRVQFLQSLQASSDPWTGTNSEGAPATTPRRRENSRTGFGRRLTSRFGPPALQSAQPYEESRVDTSHSYLGLNTPRLSHVEEHGHVGSRIRPFKSPSITDTVSPAAQKRPQYKAVAPWRGMSRSKSSRSMGRSQEGNDMDGHRSGMADHNHIVAGATKLSLTARQDDMLNFSREYRSNEADTMNSENSFATTSTIRRQSVRDLFHDYGIERPKGLVSSMESSHEYEDSSYPTRAHRFCHLCSWVNSGPSTRCWRCNHHLCSACDAQTPRSAPRKETGLSFSDRFMKSKPLKDQTSHILPSEVRRIVETEPVKSTPSRPGPTPIQRRTEHITTPRRKGSSPPIKFPEFHPKSSFAAKPKQAIYPPKSLSNASSKAIDISSRARVRTSVKESPFLVADSSAKKNSIILFPFDPSSDFRQSILSHDEHRLQHDYHHQHSSSSSSATSLRCENSNCHANHCEHPHAMSPTKKPQTRRLHERTETGYIADASLDEEEDHMQPSDASMHAHYSTHSKARSQVPQNCLDSHHHQQEASDDICISESVECRGYPRTGQFRHGSCSGKELIGECQHCLEDCQCVACQSTPHDVRCCIHKDHKAILHQHHTPRREFSVLFPHVRPLSTLGKASMHSSPISAIRGESPQTPDTQPSTRTGPEQNRTSRQVLSKQPSLEKVHIIPFTKKSTFIKRAPKPPTPPPWVAVPRSSLLKPLQQEPPQVPPGEVISPPLASAREIVRIPTTKGWMKASIGNEQHTNTVHDNQEAKVSLSSRRRSNVNRATVSSKNTARTSSRMKISPPEFRKASNSRKNSVPALRDNLLQYQQEKRSSQVIQHERSEAAPSGGVTRISDKKNQIPEQEIKRPGPNTVKSMSVLSRDSMKNWRSELVDKRPSLPRMNDDKKILSGRNLEDDSIDRRVKKQERKATSEARPESHNRGADEHECSWRRMVFDIQSGGGQFNYEAAKLGIEGLAIILHFDKQGDMVLKAGSWTTAGGPRVHG